MNDKNYRKLLAVVDYFCGYNAKLKQEAQLIVYEPNDKSLARLYEKTGGTRQWQCNDCKILKKKVYIKIHTDELYAPLQHSCKPKPVEMVLEDQKRYRNLAIFGDGKHVNASRYFNEAKFVKFEEDEYEFGLNNVRRPDSCLIVKNKTKDNFVYEYYTDNKKWYCRKCFSSADEKEYGAFVNGFLYLPKFHSCRAITIEESNEEQAALESDEPEADILFLKYRRRLKHVNESDIQYGVTQKFKKLKDKKLLIICDSMERDNVIEYFYKAPSVWQCISCCLKKKKDSFAILKDGSFYVSTNHECTPKSYFDVMEKQIKLLNYGKTRDEINSLLKMIDRDMPLSATMKSSYLFSSSKILLPDQSTVLQQENNMNQKFSNRTRSRTVAIQSETVQQRTNISASNSGIQRRLPRSRSFTIPSSSSAVNAQLTKRKMRRPRKDTMLSSESLSSEASSSILTEPLNNESPKVTENQENIPIQSFPLKRGFQTNFPVSFFDEQFPCSKKIKTEETAVPIIHMVIPDVNSSIPNLILTEPMPVENRVSETRANYSISEPWQTFDDVVFSSSNVRHGDKDILRENNLPSPLFNEDYQAVTQTTFNTTVDLNSTSSIIKDTVISYGCHFKSLTVSSNKSINAKLKIPFNEQQNVPQVNIDLIISSSVPSDTVVISTEKDSFFKCLSIYFCGEEKYFQDIKDAVRQYFFDNFKALGIYEEIDFSQMQIFSPEFLSFHHCQYLNSVHFNFISKWLNLRIGIFKNTTVEKYGNWNCDESPCILVKYDKGFYSLVLTLV